jgi:branched-chain amino acid transport system permease protein
MIAFLESYDLLLMLIGTNSLLGLSMYLVVASGQLSVANAGFMSLGAYTSALLMMKLGVPFALCLLGAMVVGAVISVALGLPVLRLRLVYLAIATIAFGEVVKVIALNLEITGGAVGLTGIPVKTTLPLTWLIVAVCTYAIYRLERSRHGRALRAIREDEAVARNMGINVARYRMFAFILSGALAALAGALQAHRTYFVIPTEFGFGKAVDILCFTVVGGTYTVFGSLVGAALMTALPEVLRFLGNYRPVVNGLVLILVITFMPGGLVGTLWGRRSKEIWRKIWKGGAKQRGS